MRRKSSLGILAASAIILLGLLSQPVLANSSVGSWNSTSPLALGVFEQGCAIGGGYVYCVGGWTEKGTSTSEAQYAPVGSAGTLGTWQPTTSYPLSASGTSCVYLSGYVYCVGGWTISGGNSLYYNNVYYAQVQSDGSLGTWQSASGYPQYGGSNLADISCVVGSGYIYCIGGGNEFHQSDGVYYAQVQSDGSLGTWQSASGYPVSTSSMSCATDSSYVYCVGGYFTDEVNYAQILSDGALGSWQSGTSYTPAASSQVTALSCPVVTGYLYCVGGDTTGAILNSVASAQIEPDGSLGTWQGTTAYPTQILYESCLADGSYLLCIGGEGSTQNGLSNVYSGEATVPTIPTAAEVFPYQATGTVGTPVGFQADVVDLVGTSPPTGPISWSDGGAGGTFNQVACGYSSDDTEYFCGVTYVPSAGGIVDITATYQGDATHLPSSSGSTLTVTEPTTTTFSCSPDAVEGDAPSQCTATVSSSGGAVPPEDLTFTIIASETGITPPPPQECVVVGSVCQATVTLTPTYLPPGVYEYGQVLEAYYPGASEYVLPSSGFATLTVFSPAPSTTSVSCLPSSVGESSYAECTATVSGPGSTAAGELVQWEQTGGTGSASFVPSTCNLSSSLSCSVMAEPSGAGTVDVEATYAGDTYNEPSSGTFTLTVNLPPSSISTAVYDGSTGLPWSSGETAGASGFDTATVTGIPGTTPTGSVTYTLFSNGACSSPGSASTVSLTALGAVPDSAPTAPLSAGSYSYQATYSGDSNYQGSTSSCEAFTVGAVSPTIATQVSNSGTITVGSSGSDSATLSGAYDAGGTVTFTAYGDAVCGGVVFTSTVALSGSTATSGDFTPTSAGTYYWEAAYSGDSNNNPVSSACGGAGETLTVDPDSPTIATSLSSPSITVGESASDSATLSGASSSAGGTVQYQYFRSFDCRGAGTPVGAPVPVMDGVVSDSQAIQFASAGAYGWDALYSGDVNNHAALSPCESLSVLKASTFTAVICSPSSVGIASSTECTATVMGVNPTGSVGFTSTSSTGVFAPSEATCSLDATGQCSVSYSDTSAGSPTILGTYSGDGNNVGSSGSTVVNVSYNSCPQVSDRGGQNLKGADLEYCNLAGYNLSGDNLQGANLMFTDLQDANLQGANMQRASLDNAYAPGADFQGANMQGASLSYAVLTGDNLQGANLQGSDLSGGSANGATFRGANLQKANLSEGTFVGDDFRGANLQGSNMSYGDFDGGNFQGANTHGADITGATFVGATNPP